MRSAIFLALALCIVAAVASPIEKRDAMSAFAGLPEIHTGHAPAKDYIVIEINKPIIHYFAAEAHREEEKAE